MGDYYDSIDVKEIGFDFIISVLIGVTVCISILALYWLLLRAFK